MSRAGATSCRKMLEFSRRPQRSARSTFRRSGGSSAPATRVSATTTRSPHLSWTRWLPRSRRPGLWRAAHWRGLRRLRRRSRRLDEGRPDSSGGGGPVPRRVGPTTDDLRLQCGGGSRERLGRRAREQAHTAQVLEAGLGSSPRATVHGLARNIWRRQMDGVDSEGCSGVTSAYPPRSSSRGAGGTKTVTETTTVTSPATTKTLLGAPGERLEFGHIKSLTRKGDHFELRFDPAWFLSGETASKAAAEDGAVEPGQPVPNDNYVVEEGHRLLTYPVPGDAHVTVLTRRRRPGAAGRDADPRLRAGPDRPGQGPPRAVRALAVRRLDQGRRGRRPRDRPTVPAVAPASRGGGSLRLPAPARQARGTTSFAYPEADRRGTTPHTEDQGNACRA